MVTRDQTAPLPVKNDSSLIENGFGQILTFSDHGPYQLLLNWDQKLGPSGCDSHLTDKVKMEMRVQRGVFSYASISLPPLVQELGN